MSANYQFLSKPPLQGLWGVVRGLKVLHFMERYKNPLDLTGVTLYNTVGETMFRVGTPQFSFLKASRCIDVFEVVTGNIPDVIYMTLGQVDLYLRSLPGLGNVNLKSALFSPLKLRGIEVKLKQQ